MRERFVNIMAKKEEICIKRNDVKEEKKAESFAKFIAVQEKMVKLQEKNVELTTALEGTKMLTMKMSVLESRCNKDRASLLCAKMLKRLAANLKEPADEEESTRIVKNLA